MASHTSKDRIIRENVFYSAVSNYTSKFITLGTWFLLMPFILKHIGPSGYGLWVLIGSTLEYGTILNFGMSGAIVKYVAEYRAKGEFRFASSVIATALCLYCALGLVAVSLSMALAPYFPDLFTVPAEDETKVTGLVRLMGIGIGISIPCSTATAVLCGLNRFDLSNALNIVGTILTAIGTVVVLFLGGGISGMVLVNITVMLVMQVPTIWVINRIAPELQFGWHGAQLSLVRKVTSFSWPLFLNDMADRVQTKTDEVIIGLFLSVSSIAPYTIARKLSEIAQVLAYQFMKVLLPLASELDAENDRDRLRFVYITGTRLTLAIFIPVASILIVLGRPILTAWVGPMYADYTYLVTILTVASFMYISQWPGGFVLQGMSKHRPLVILTSCTAVGNLALSVILVQKFGLLGVALGTLIPATVVYLGIFLPYVMRIIGVKLAEALPAIFLPAVLPVVPMVILLYVSAYLIKPVSLLSLIAIGTSGIAVYMMVYLSVGACRAERELCRSFIFSTIDLARLYLRKA